MITIVDYGLGNLGSVKNMLRHIGFQAVITGDPSLIAEAGCLILPGVGAFDNGMRHIKERGLLEILNRKALVERVPVLGLCLGMQLMAEGSEEGSEPGLGWIGGRAVKFAAAGGLRIPHMGWNSVRIVNDCALSRGFLPEMRFYFVHSYHVVCDDRRDVFLSAEYGGEIVAAVRRGNIMGTQFHPEKSHSFGMIVLRNFAESADA